MDFITYRKNFKDKLAIVCKLHDFLDEIVQENIQNSPQQQPSKTEATVSQTQQDEEPELAAKPENTENIKDDETDEDYDKRMKLKCAEIIHTINQYPTEELIMKYDLGFWFDQNTDNSIYYGSDN